MTNGGVGGGVGGVGGTPAVLTSLILIPVCSHAEEDLDLIGRWDLCCRAAFCADEPRRSDEARLLSQQ